MSILLDDLLEANHVDDGIYYRNHGWYIAKPLFYSGLVDRLKDAYRVLVGKSQAYHYLEDEEG